MSSPVIRHIGKSVITVPSSPPRDEDYCYRLEIECVIRHGKGMRCSARKGNDCSLLDP